MRLIAFLIARNWGVNRLRTWLSILGIALGVGVVVAIHIMDHNTIQSRLRELRPDYGRVDLELIPRNSAADLGALRARLAGRADVRDVGLIQQTFVEVRRGGEVLDQARMFGLNPLPNGAFAHYFVERGDDLDDLDGDGFVLIGTRLAEAFAIDVGDQIVLVRPDVAPPARCVGGRLVVASQLA